MSKAAESKAPEAAAQAAPDKSKKRLGILIVISFLGLITLKMGFIFFFIGMLPAVVAYATDNDPKKYASYTVAALNFSGVLPYMVDIYIQGGTFTAIGHKLASLEVWFVMYGAAAVGWAIVFLSPIVAAAVLEGVYSGRVVHLENLQKKVVEEWGEEVTGHKEEKS